jgi:nitroreductase
MDLYRAIRERRSIRKYKSDPVSDEVLQRLLDAAQWAPSWAHTQCCDVVVVRDPAQKQRLQASLPPKNPAFKAMVDAPVVVAFCGRAGRAGFKKGEAATPRGDWMMFDVALAMQNFMLAAHAEGLATVCVGLFDAAAAGSTLRCPDGVEVLALTPLGYPDMEANVPPRKEPADFARLEYYE